LAAGLTKEVCKCVDLIDWDNLRMGMGYRTRRRGDYVLVLQKPPITATTWSDHGIPSRWPEKVDRKIHPHVKPAGFIERLIGAVTHPGDLVVDPAAGSFVVMHVAMEIGRQFIGCDKAYRVRQRMVRTAHATWLTGRSGQSQIEAWVGLINIPTPRPTRSSIVRRRRLRPARVGGA
jgi:hypothetical protein